MVGRRRLIAKLALVGAFAMCAFPADGSAIAAVFIALTPSGPSPAVMTIGAGMYPVWTNQDTVAHTVVFADGQCSVQVAPGGFAQCSGFSSFVGNYAYTVDGTAQASVEVEPEGRTVTLGARSHRIARGSHLRLHGVLDAEHPSPPGPGPAQPVVILACHDGMHRWHRVATVMAKVHRTKGTPFGTVTWQLRVHPRRSTIYVAEADSQPAGGQFWDQARSRPFKVVVRR